MTYEEQIVKEYTDSDISWEKKHHIECNIKGIIKRTQKEILEKIEKLVKTTNDKFLREVLESYLDYQISSCSPKENQDE